MRSDKSEDENRNETDTFNYENILKQWKNKCDLSENNLISCEKKYNRLKKEHYKLLSRIEDIEQEDKNDKDQIYEYEKQIESFFRENKFLKKEIRKVIERKEKEIRKRIRPIEDKHREVTMQLNQKIYKLEMQLNSSVESEKENKIRLRKWEEKYEKMENKLTTRAENLNDKINDIMNNRIRNMSYKSSRIVEKD